MLTWVRFKPRRLSVVFLNFPGNGNGNGNDAGARARAILKFLCFRP